MKSYLILTKNLIEINVKGTEPLGFRIQISDYGLHWHSDILCACLYFSCAYMLYVHAC